MLSLGTTVLTLLVGFPTAYFIATRPENDPRTLAVPDHHTVLDQPSDPHLCHPGDHAQRGADQRLAAEVRADRKPMQMLFTDGAILTAWSMSTCR
jgi:spermidine/putrescine transport system permease protein